MFAWIVRGVAMHTTNSEVYFIEENGNGVRKCGRSYVCLVLYDVRDTNDVLTEISFPTKPLKNTANISFSSYFTHRLHQTGTSDFSESTVANFF